MEAKDLCEIFNFKCTKEVEKNTKVNQLIEYINQNHIEYYEVEKNLIKREAFLAFIENINSVASAAKILEKYSNLASVGFYPVEVAQFFNVYSPEKFVFPGKKIASILLSQEYLKVASIEWTREHILDYSFGKVLYINGKKITVEDNILTEENEDEYVPSIDRNIEAIEKAQQNNILKQAIESLN